MFVGRSATSSCAPVGPLRERPVTCINPPRPRGRPVPDPTAQRAHITTTYKSRLSNRYIAKPSQLCILHSRPRPTTLSVFALVFRRPRRRLSQSRRCQCRPLGQQRQAPHLQQCRRYYSKTAARAATALSQHHRQHATRVRSEEARATAHDGGATRIPDERMPAPSAHRAPGPLAREHQQPRVQHVACISDLP
jgi:hypothetical protein